MNTASQVVVALVLTMVVAFPVGVWVAESRRAEKAVRPVLDILQTLPQLVYLIPFVYLFPISYVPGIIAARAVRGPGRDPARVGRRPRCAGEHGRGGAVVRRDAWAGADEGEDPARARGDHARREPGHHHGAGRRRHRRAGRIGRARLRGRTRIAAGPVRRGRRGVDRHPGARHRAGPCHPGEPGRRGWREVVDRTKGGGLHVEIRVAEEPVAPTALRRCRWRRSRSPASAARRPVASRAAPSR